MVAGVKFVNALFLNKANQAKMLSTLLGFQKKNEERIIPSTVTDVVLFKPTQPFETEVEFFATLQMGDAGQV